MTRKSGAFSRGTIARARRDVFARGIIARGIMKRGIPAVRAYKIATSMVRKGAKPGSAKVEREVRAELKEQTAMKRRKGVTIYGKIDFIGATKTDGKYKGKPFIHHFRKRADIIGMPDGSLRIVPAE